MTTYRVTCEGDVREVYLVEADSLNDAVEKWATGQLLVSEASGVEPVSAEVEDQ